MRHLCGVFVSVAVLLGATVAASAQASNPSDALLPSRPVAGASERVMLAPDLYQEDAAQAAELKRWMTAFAQWQTWSAEYGNTREPGWFTSYRDRREKPRPPAWLSDECDHGLLETVTLAQACSMLTEYDEDPSLTRARLARAAAATQQEDAEKSVWWQHVHLDVLWPATQLRESVYGVVGTHVTTTIKGRLQVFIAPGAMVLNLPTLDGHRAWKLATNYGIGYRLGGFSLLGHPAMLNLNLAKAWVVADSIDLATGRSLDFAGFSMTFSPDR